MGAMAILRLALIFSIFTSISLLAGYSPSPELQIDTAERRIDLNSHIVKVFLTLKKKNKSYLPLDVKPTDLPDGPNGTKYYLIHLLKPLGKGEAISLEVLYMLTHSLEPFPEEISLSEPQLVYYRDSAKFLSPYPIKQQATFLKTPTSRVESFTRVVPADRANTELRYGPYEEQPPYSYSPVIVHFENNNVFAVVEELVREIEISHWGSIQVTEHYKLVHAGARHKGNPSAVVPFPVEQRAERKYSYLDVVGRTVVVLEKANVVPEHNSPFQVYYQFSPIYMLAEPLMLTSQDQENMSFDTLERTFDCEIKY
ncbi:hypothetical protein K7X08_030159 [Anisodus acutangulus]|uniref:Dolichyl-diphosphooligosaccharide--protein glycosyltransferase subunit 1 n=1 Tax=Anisodus acutangulus TaxID=402998 RepID=A0A9Q1LM04_9SOLA|nr:hypothetical protein K7X08_030159 [Anisodus acutangulus]